MPTKPVLHRRDHERGGADPVRLIWDDGEDGDVPLPETFLRYRMDAVSGDQPEESAAAPALAALGGTETPGTYLAPAAPIASNPGSFSFNEGAGTISDLYTAGTHFQATANSAVSFYNRSPFTISVWVYPYSGWIQEAGGIPGLIVGTAEWSHHGWGISLVPPAGSAKITVTRGSGSAFDQITSTTITAMNAWTHVAFSYDGDTMKLYQNGVLTDSLASTLNISFTIDNLKAGFGDWSGVGGYFYGRVDDIRIYFEALTDAQIASLAGV